MKLKNLIRDTLFVKSLKLIKSNFGKIGMMVLFDILFILSYFSLKKIFEYFSQPLNPVISSSVFAFFVFSSVYYLAILFVYSFFKYSILDFIKSLFGQSKFSFNRLLNFYLLNAIIAAIFFALVLLLNYILISIKQNYAPYVFVFLVVPYILFLYVIINISHSLFYEGCSIKNSIKAAFSMAFAKIKSYRETILVIIFCAFALLILFLAFDYLIRTITSKNYSSYLSIYQYFKQAAVVVLDAVFYFILLTNRISFYNLVKHSQRS